jgi:glucose-6-phosphate 1-dehydrogenase
MRTLILFGASGDLAQEKLFPALYENYKQGFDCKYIGYGRTPLSDTSFRNVIKNSIDKDDEKFLKKFSYIQGSYNKEGIKELAKVIDPSKTIFYLAIPNRFNIVKELIEGLNYHNLIKDNTQIIIEKPFGEDYESAKKLRNLLKEKVGEDKIYPIDHYLAKDLVRNLITLRFANPVFENLWNNQYIRQIDINIEEQDGIKNRGEYYDRTGATKDMIQNHALQLLSLITLNQPKSFNSKDFHIEKEKVLKNTKIFNDNYEDNIKIGQYKEYKNEKHINPHSNTETYASIKFEVKNNRWKDVPIKITTGKKLERKHTSIKIYFQPFENCLWEDKCELVTQNILMINIYPENNILLSINTEFKPNTELPKTKNLELGFPKDSLLNLAYSNALKDIYNREKSYTPSFNEILYSWKLIDNIEDWLKGKKDKLLKIY